MKAGGQECTYEKGRVWCGEGRFSAWGLPGYAFEMSWVRPEKSYVRVSTQEAASSAFYRGVIYAGMTHITHIPAVLQEGPHPIYLGDDEPKVHSTWRFPQVHETELGLDP